MPWKIITTQRRDAAPYLTLAGGERGKSLPFFRELS